MRYPWNHLRDARMMRIMLGAHLETMSWELNETPWRKILRMRTRICSGVIAEIIDSTHLRRNKPHPVPFYHRKYISEFIIEH